MYAQREKSKENKSRAAANSATQKKSNVQHNLGFADNRPLLKRDVGEGFIKNVMQRVKTKEGDEIPTYLYHGTSDENADLIIKGGLGGLETYISRLTKAETSKPRTVWLSSKQSNAVGAGEGSVIKVNTAGMTATKLHRKKSVDPHYQDGTVWYYTGTVGTGDLEKMKKKKI